MLTLFRLILGGIVVYFLFNGIDIVEVGRCDTLTATCD